MPPRDRHISLLGRCSLYAQWRPVLALRDLTETGDSHLRACLGHERPPFCRASKVGFAPEDVTRPTRGQKCGATYCPPVPCAPCWQALHRRPGCRPRITLYPIHSLKMMRYTLFWIETISTSISKTKNCIRSTRKMRNGPHFTSKMACN